MRTASLIFYELNILKSEAAKVGKIRARAFMAVSLKTQRLAGRAPACHPRCDIFVQRRTF